MHMMSHPDTEEGRPSIAEQNKQSAERRALLKRTWTSQDVALLPRELVVEMLAVYEEALDFMRLNVHIYERGPGRLAGDAVGLHSREFLERIGETW